MTTSAQHRAVVEALGLTPHDLRELAGLIEAAGPTVLVCDVVEAAIANLPPGHLYRTSLRRLVSWAGGRDATSVAPADVADWARRAAAEARERPNARHGFGAQEAFVLAVRAAYARAVDAGTLRENPATEVSLPVRPAGRRTALSSDQLKQIRLALVAGSRDPRLDDLVFQFLRETGCRRGGVIGLERTALAPATRTARVVEKYGKDRWQPVSAHLVERLQRHVDAASCSCRRLFHRADGGHLTDRWFDSFGRRIQRLGWAREVGVTAHWLRHTTLTDVERLAGLRVAAAYAGHADSGFGVTGRYTKVSPDELRIAHERLFFDDSADAADPTRPPMLFRRVIPGTPGPVEFAAAS
jgi:site-specific recombinase XerD